MTNLHGHLIHHPGVSRSDSQPLGPTLDERALNCSSMSRNLSAHMLSGGRQDGSKRQQPASRKRWQKRAKAAAEHLGTPADRNCIFLQAAGYTLTCIYIHIYIYIYLCVYLVVCMIINLSVERVNSLVQYPG